MTIELDERDACCLNCLFWQRSDVSNYGRCRRYPPQFWSEGEDSGAAQVGTCDQDWCGEYQPNENQGYVLPKGFKIIDSKGNELGET